MCCFLCLDKKLIDTLTHMHLHAGFPPLTIFYLLVNVPNYSVKHCQRFAAWHAYWNGNATTLKVFHSLASKWIYSWQFTLLMQDYTNERVKGLCVSVCVCVWLFSAFMRRTLAPERKGHVSTASSSPLFRRRGLDLVLYHFSSLCSLTFTSCYLKDSGVYYSCHN